MSALRAIAESLVEAWRPACERIEIAGSIRRGRPDPHDIEIVTIPKIGIAAASPDMFTDQQVIHVEHNLLDSLLEQWRGTGRLRDRPDKNGRPAWGSRFKRCLYEGVAVDVFSVLPPARWGVIFAIRTGPADFSRGLVTSRRAGGFMPVGMQVKDGALWLDGQRVSTPEEEDFFAAIKLPCWPPG